VARRRRGRPIDGILILDKPLGPSSNRALQTVKNLYFAAKAGHTGSLDPLATGVLPICFGEATKFSQYLLDADKIYTSTFLLGVTTASGDSEGEELERKSAASIDLEMLEK
jgi:tRNA pseudouridine55 synthase